MNMQFTPFHSSIRYRKGSDTYVIYQANVGGADYGSVWLTGATVVAVEHNGIFYPRRPELDESYGKVAAKSRRELEAKWFMYETKAVDYDALAGRAIHHGIHPWFDLLKDTTIPSAEDRARNPYGGFPLSAFHDGVTIKVLDRRRAGLSAALIRIGMLADKDFRPGRAATLREYVAAALDAVDRMWRRAFDKREPLPPGSLRCFTDAQLWWPPHIYSAPSGDWD